jgi:hypothetical protein
MKVGGGLVLAFLFALEIPCYAAEDEKKKPVDELTSIQMGNHSLKFEGDAPRRTVAPDDPPGMTNFRKEIPGPFLGLKFSTPLK